MIKTKIDAYSLLKKIRQEKPIVHHLTNWVTIYDCANIVKVLGASPVMAHAKEEAAQMANIASSLVLNIGTLTPEFVEAMKIAARSANKKGIPVILDVCGAGATRLRDEKSFELLNEVRIDIIKGNASEIVRLSGENIRTKGVDSSEVEQDMLAVTGWLSNRFKAVVVATGKHDIVNGKGKSYIIKNGHPIMTHVVGTGCMAASVIGTFAAVSKDLVCATVSALACFEIAAELAVKKSKGPASFKEKLFDCIFDLDDKAINKMQKIYL
ncbi:MAG: hydroxyethylthiazole kinase [Candidatus Omnitrophica bacterium]|jgi:hydroxyethylthiazole kinase|nr:hydroxyethylthiazole kinase [Candidatus Omnitrophota bacterium]